MITPSDKEYIETKRIIQGTERMKEEFIPLAKWIENTYDVKPINIIYDTLSDKRPRIRICFEFSHEMEKFLTHDIAYFDKLKQKTIGEMFSKTISQQARDNGTTSVLSIFRSNIRPVYSTKDVFVVYSAFKPIALMEATYMITKERIREFIESFNNANIWTISIGSVWPTFFMFTDEQVREYDKPEVKSVWADKYFDLLKPFDEFNYLTIDEVKVFLDSKENFDKNYESSWYYYYK